MNTNIINYNGYHKQAFELALENSLLGEYKLSVLAYFADNAKPGNFAELGVYKGGSAFYMASQCKDKLFLFDTFEGIPNSDGSIDGHSNGDFNDARFEDVQLLLSRYNNITFCKGYFPDTARDLPHDFSFVHIDGDTYRTTKDAIDYFFPKLIPGGIILFDDYNWMNCHGVKRAIHEFLDSLKNQTIGIDLNATAIGDPNNAQFVIVKGGFPWNE